jgi:hypothetical protein
MPLVISTREVGVRVKDSLALRSLLSRALMREAPPLGNCVNSSPAALATSFSLDAF